MYRKNALLAGGDFSLTVTQKKQQHQLQISHTLSLTTHSTLASQHAARAKYRMRPNTAARFPPVRSHSMDDPRALCALSVALAHGTKDCVASQLSRLGSDEATLREARAACPLLFAAPGDYFWHPVELTYDTSHYYASHGVELFKYRGRTGSTGET